MINFKVLFGAMLALAAFGVVSASGAQAAEFHCSVEPCRYRLKPDGEGTTAHHVFIIDDKTTGESVSFTCPFLSGEGTTATKTASTLTVTNLVYGPNDVSCKVNGSTGITVDMMGCDYKFSAAGTVTVECPVGQRIRIEKTGCTYEIGPQGPLNGITYHNIETTAGIREVTVSANVAGIVVEVTGTKAACLIEPSSSGHVLEGTYTTGNTRVTAETDPGEVRADGWWL